MPGTIIAKRGDEITIINIDNQRVHRIHAPNLAGFDTGDLYPASYRSEKKHPYKFTYSLKDAQLGSYYYRDDYNKYLSGKIIIEDYPPWENHPGYTGAKPSEGPTRIVAARVPATRLNKLNEITPASVEKVTVEVWLGGGGSATLNAGLRDSTNSVKATCDQRTVDGHLKQVETFEVDARSLPDGELNFEIELNGEIYHVPGPVLKTTDGATFPAAPAKKVINVARP